MQPIGSVMVLGHREILQNKPATSKDAKVTKSFTTSEILDKMNTPPVILLMGLISSLNNLSSQILGVLGLQARYQLVNIGLWGLCLMSAFVWGFFSPRPESGPEAIILNFPTVYIICFIPHLLFLVGIILCGCIYSLAFSLCFLSLLDDGTRPQLLSDSFRIALENMQANAQLTNIRLDMQRGLLHSVVEAYHERKSVGSATGLHTPREVRPSGPRGGNQDDCRAEGWQPRYFAARSCWL